MKKEIFQWNRTQLSIPAEGFPLKLYVELTSRCNFLCRGCFRESFQEPETDLSEEVLETILSSIDPKTGVKDIFLGGIGEPLLHPRFSSFVQRAVQAGARVAVQSNGSRLDEGMIEFLIDLGIDKIVLSYETGSFGHVTGAGEIFGHGTLPGFPEGIIKKIIEHKRALHRNKPTIAIEWVLSTDSLAELEDFTDTAVRVGVDELIFSNLLPVSEAAEEKILYRVDSCGEHDELLHPLTEKIRHRLHYVLPKFSLKTERHCRFIEQNAAVVRSDGEVVPCYRLLHQATERVDGKEMELIPYSFGNLSSTGIEEIWNSRDYLWFRFTVQNGLYPSCLDCSLKEGCEYLRDSTAQCWGGSPSCGNCLWSRQIVLCP